MDKKEIYEHLANIYLDASSSKKRKKVKKKSAISNWTFAVIAIAVLPLGIFALKASFAKPRANISSVSLVLYPDIAKINFNFDPAKKEIYALGLNRLNLLPYKQIEFSVKKSNWQDSLFLKVEFTNSFREKSSVYLKDISDKWTDYKISLAEFKEISDWSEMASLSFIVEEWNALADKDVIYIDNIRAVK